jgi:hypothetical protein
MTLELDGTASEPPVCCATGPAAWHRLLGRQPTARHDALPRAAGATRTESAVGARDERLGGI